MGKSKDIIVLSSDSEDFNEGPSKGKVPKEDINEGPSKGKLAPLGSSARPRPEVGPELAKLFKYGPPAHLLRWYGYADVDEYLEDPFFDSPEKETKDKSSMDTFLASRKMRSKEKKEKELIGRRETRKREGRIARRGLCRLAGRIVARLGARHDCRPAEGR
ncbi:hypothetical protein Tco_0943168, partial [Tanacetum coccineum]